MTIDARAARLNSANPRMLFRFMIPHFSWLRSIGSTGAESRRP
jgi:hypothetical protein